MRKEKDLCKEEKKKIVNITADGFTSSDMKKLIKRGARTIKKAFSNINCTRKTRFDDSKRKITKKVNHLITQSLKKIS